jgi:hypothetical protein
VTGAALCSDHVPMKTASLRDGNFLHPFGGCNRLLEQYHQVGQALLHYERRICGALIPGPRLSREFGHAVSFVPVEVLESYLDDLLDVGVSDESLFIKKLKPAKRALALIVIGVAALGASAIEVLNGATLASLSALILVTFFAGLGAALYFIPRMKVIRRFSFATLVSGEIARRRGYDRTNVGGFATRLLMRDLWQRGESQGPAIPPYPARVAARYYH